MAINTIQRAIERAIRAAGNQTALAEIVGVKQNAVSNWLRRAKRVPGKHVLPIEKATGVSRHDLNPDLYPRERVS